MGAYPRLTGGLYRDEVGGMTTFALQCDAEHGVRFWLVGRGSSS